MQRYTLLEEIGHGGMGCVYKGRDNFTGNMVAIKMMSNKVTCYPEYRQLFQSEVDTLKRMDHPSVVHIVGDPYQEEGNLYLPMEYVTGETIEQHVSRSGVFPVDEAVRIMLKVLEAIQYVHDRGKIHRDIKPSNIMIRPDRSVCIIDFGIAKDARVGTGQTVGRIIGTDGYMSPEQAKGLNIDKRTDIYALGCVFYFLLTGKHAIPKGNNDYETVCNILQSIPALPSEAAPGIPVQFDAIFLKAVDKNMTMRYQSAADFKEAIEGINGNVVPKVTVGRLADNDIQIADNQDVSRHHLIIRGIDQPVTGGRTKYLIEITDDSTNGTGINGKLLKHQSTIIEYNGTVNLPEVLLAGRPELVLNWNQVISLLKSKGWKPFVSRGGGGGDDLPSVSEKLDLFLCIVSFLIPLVGLILWGVYRKEHPQKAEWAAKLALGGFVIGFIINIIVGAL